MRAKGRAAAWWLGAVLVALAIAAQPACALDHESVKNAVALDQLSTACAQDFGTLMADEDVQDALVKISRVVQTYITGRKMPCLAPAHNCHTLFAQNQNCCTFDGLQLWADSENAGLLDNLKSAGSGSCAGNVEYMSQMITLDQQNPISWTTMSLGFVQPWYMPRSCMNPSDAQEFGLAASAACQRANSIPGADTKLCTLTF